MYDGRRTLPERCSADVLQLYQRGKTSSPTYTGNYLFLEVKNKFRRMAWNVWKMRKTFVIVVRKEMPSLGMRKVEFALLVQMLKKNENDERILVDNYFKK